MAGPGTPTFYILALGPPGSGKTVYLAMLHRVISTRFLGPGVGFAIDDNGDRAWLQAAYKKIIDTRIPQFSDKTPGADIREITLRCQIGRPASTGRFGRRIRGQQHTAFLINYTDYAGERLTRANTYAVPGIADDFQRKLEQAHAMLGIIDGEQLLRYLNDPVGNRDYFLDNVWPIVATMRGHTVPCQFVVTKWDLLAGHTPEEIEALLRSASDQTGYRLLMDERSAERRAAGEAGRIRVIPVSSVGEFAQLTAEGMRKVPDRDPTPVNVEVPLIAALVDVCDMAGKILGEQRRRQREGARRPREPGGDESEESSTGTVAVGAFGVKVNLATIVAFTRGTGTVLGRPAFSVGRLLRREYHRVASHGLSGVRSEEGALFYAGRELGRQLAAYEDRVGG
ncbi:MAG TPA: hypothetical protein VHZ33_21220 [Trebonia sp.]|nr:hypothetical protein [Trebonia sp.]